MMRQYQVSKIHNNELDPRLHQPPEEKSLQMILRLLREVIILEDLFSPLSSLSLRNSEKEEAKEASVVIRF